MAELALLSNFSTAAFQKISRPKSLIPRFQREIYRLALGEEIYLLRLECGYSRRYDLAFILKISPRTMAALELGRETEITVEILHRIAKAFSRQLSIKTEDGETHYSLSTPLEKLIAHGARITFIQEG